jgi:hypothetical protein
MLTVFPRPTDPVLNINTSALTFTRYSSLAPENNPRSKKNLSITLPFPPRRLASTISDPTNVLFAGTIAEDGL